MGTSGGYAAQAKWASPTGFFDVQTAQPAYIPPPQAVYGGPYPPPLPGWQPAAAPPYQGQFAAAAVGPGWGAGGGPAAAQPYSWRYWHPITGVQVFEEPDTRGAGLWTAYYEGETEKRWVYFHKMSGKCQYVAPDGWVVLPAQGYYP